MSCVFRFCATDGGVALRRAAEAAITTGAILRKRGIGDPSLTASHEHSENDPQGVDVSGRKLIFLDIGQSPIVDESVSGTLMRMDPGRSGSPRRDVCSQEQTMSSRRPAALR